MQPYDEPARPVSGSDAAALVEVLGLSYHLSSAIERLVAGAKAGSAGVPALREAAWSIRRYAALLEDRPVTADLHRSVARLDRIDAAVAEARALSAALLAGPGRLDASRTVV
jgi:hypothetical protein